MARKQPKLNKTTPGGMGFYAKNDVAEKPAKTPSPKKGTKKS